MRFLIKGSTQQVPMDASFAMVDERLLAITLICKIIQLQMTLIDTRVDKSQWKSRVELMGGCAKVPMC